MRKMLLLVLAALALLVASPAAAGGRFPIPNTDVAHSQCLGLGGWVDSVVGSGTAWCNFK